MAAAAGVNPARQRIDDDDPELCHGLAAASRPCFRSAARSGAWCCSTGPWPISAARRCAGGGARGIAIAMLLLSARAEARQRLAALASGADDDLAKPFAIEELRARLRRTVETILSTRRRQIAPWAEWMAQGFWIRALEHGAAVAAAAPVPILDDQAGRRACGHRLGAARGFSPGPLRQDAGQALRKLRAICPQAGQLRGRDRDGMVWSARLGVLLASCLMD